MKVLLTGRNGQVGHELERALAPLGGVFSFDHKQLDLADPIAIVEFAREALPRVPRLVPITRATLTSREHAEAARYPLSLWQRNT
ncbi:MAG: sugar nucleotide-binding protein [Polyangiales bacterium]